MNIHLVMLRFREKKKDTVSHKVKSNQYFYKRDQAIELNFAYNDKSSSITSGQLPRSLYVRITCRISDAAKRLLIVNLYYHTIN